MIKEAETPKSRSFRSLQRSANQPSSWIGPSSQATSSNQTGPGDVHRSGEKRKRKNSIAVVTVNTLPGGSHSDPENDSVCKDSETNATFESKEIAIKKDQKEIKKRRKVNRITYPRSRKKADKIKVCGLDISSSRYEKNGKYFDAKYK